MKRDHDAKRANVAALTIAIALFAVFWYGKRRRNRETDAFAARLQRDHR